VGGSAASAGPGAATIKSAIAIAGARSRIRSKRTPFSQAIERMARMLLPKARSRHITDSSPPHPFSGVADGFLE
jgi:hypothetical protein